MLIVIVVIGIIATVTIVAYGGIQDKANATAAQAEQAQLVRRIEAQSALNPGDAYPTSISDCPNPAATNLCISPKPGQTLAYYVFVPGAANRYSAAMHSTASQAFELEVRNSSRTGFFYSSNVEMSSSNEFVQYMDMAPMIDKYGLRKYTISFDIKSASTASASTVSVYMQNGSGARYDFGVSVPVTTSYVRQTVTVTPTGPNTTFTQSILAFYGTYGTGNKPTIRNVEIKAG